MATKIAISGDDQTRRAGCGWMCSPTQLSVGFRGRALRRPGSRFLAADRAQSRGPRARLVRRSGSRTQVLTRSRGWLGASECRRWCWRLSDDSVLSTRRAPTSVVASRDEIWQPLIVLIGVRRARFRTRGLLSRARAELRTNQKCFLTTSGKWVCVRAC
jgi:hypothetical protein